jgi:general secretion pathway protein E
MPAVRLPFSFAKKHSVFISEQTADSVVISYREPLTLPVIAECQRCLAVNIKWLESGDDFDVALAKAYEGGTESAMAAITDIEEQMDLDSLMQDMPKTQDLLESEDDAPIIRLINATLTQAVKQGASDIHFEVFEESLSVRFRIDGILHEAFVPPRALAQLIISRLKIMSKLDIAEKRLPQDGRIALKIAGRAIDVRVSTMPTQYGERIVLRLLDKQQTPLNLKALGMADDSLKIMEELISRPHGVILVTGPTGSGKTTSLYAALSQLNEQSRNIMTVEDPVEYYISGIAQTQVNTKAKMTFAKGLRAILRQDPDVIMVGEIRDLETAEMAVQASLTGHLVLSTLHTNSALGSVTRLQDMGIESFLLSTTLIGVVAQRLVRLLCPHCKLAYTPSTQDRKLLAMQSTNIDKLYKAEGCDDCLGSGYKGRSGIYEIIPIDNTLSDLIHKQASEAELATYAHQTHRSMRADGLRLVVDGRTTVDEVLRVTSAG